MCVCVCVCVRVCVCVCACARVCNVENYIDGSEFLKLSEQDIKAMIPAIGIAKKLIRLIPKVYMQSCNVVLF